MQLNQSFGMFNYYANMRVITAQKSSNMKIILNNHHLLSKLNPKFSVPMSGTQLLKMFNNNGRIAIASGTFECEYD